MKKEDLRSAIQSNFDTLVASGRCHVHHVFSGSGRRRKSEQFGYLVALTPQAHFTLHEHPNQLLDLLLKRNAQKHFEEHIGTRDDFIKEFGKSWL